jgi:hypothetical protein
MNKCIDEVMIKRDRKKVIMRAEKTIEDVIDLTLVNMKNEDIIIDEMIKLTISEETEIEIIEVVTVLTQEKEIEEIMIEEWIGLIPMTGAEISMIGEMREENRLQKKEMSIIEER